MSGSTITGNKSTLAIGSAALIASGSPIGMRIARVSVTTAGSGPGLVYDASSVATIAPAGLIATIPNAIGVYLVDFPCFAGIVFVPGAGMVASITYD